MLLANWFLCLDFNVQGKDEFQCLQGKHAFLPVSHMCMLIFKESSTFSLG